MQRFKDIKASILKPFKFLSSLFSKKSLNNIIDQVSDPNQSDEFKALSAAIGIFIGIIPIWGLQTLAAIGLATIFKLNKVLVVIFSQVSLPPLLPLVIFLSYRAGSYWVGRSGSATIKPGQNAGIHLNQYIYGSITLAFAASIIIGLLTFVLLKSIKTVKQFRLSSSLKKAL